MKRAGLLNRRLTLLKEVRSQDASGEEVRTYEPHATCAASKKALTGRERHEAQQVAAEVDMEFRVRYRRDVVATMRVQDDDGNLFDVQADGLDPDGMRRETIILASTVRPRGSSA